MSKKVESKKTITGTVRMHPRGFGFVIVDSPSVYDKDIFIPKHLTNNAVDGDHVEVLINTRSKSKKGPEGEISSIINRSKTFLSGTIELVEKKQAFAHIPLLNERHSVIIKDFKKNSLQSGDRCIFKVEKWGKEQKPTICTVSHKIGHITDPSCDTEAATEEYGLRRTFPKEVIHQAKNFGKSILKQEFKGRLDLTKSSCITIDPDTAKDFDDALSIEKTKNSYQLGVHIADVAHYVKTDTPLDVEAKKRSNSTYFPGTCIPMLPEDLSNNLCSLRQGVNRLTVSVLMEFDKKGNLKSSEIKRSVIKSKKRFSYDEALKVLKDKKKSPYSEELRQMTELCRLLKQKRLERGSIDFSLPELIIVVDSKGVPKKTKIEPYHITHQLVEEFMLKTNEVVATYLENRKKQQIFRIHEEPDPTNLKEFFSFARTLGFHLPEEPSKKNLQSLFEKAKKTPFSHQLTVGFIRNLKLACYSPRNIGHYGLALEKYCHFTSPIRRYSDLITQRLLFDEEQLDLDLEEIGKLCSEKERISFKAEVGVKLLKKLRLLNTWLEEDSQKSYPAYITKIKHFGIYFEMRALNIEGFLHISELENDYFIYDETIPILFGEKTGLQHKIGEEIKVLPIDVNLIHLEVKWELAIQSQLKRKKKKKK